MAIYVDDFKPTGPGGRMVCRLTADAPQELEKGRKKLGLPRKAKRNDHYVILQPGIRYLALQLGAERIMPFRLDELGPTAVAARARLEAKEKRRNAYNRRMARKGRKAAHHSRKARERTETGRARVPCGKIGGSQLLRQIFCLE